jgi:uncharacterized membrane protein
MYWLFLAYPVLSYIATLIHNEALAGVALTVFIAVPLLPALLRGRVWAWASLIGAATLLYWAARGGWARYLMYAPPVLIPLSVLWVFARSLLPGQTPLVTQFAARIRGDLTPELQRYTRQVTRLWVAILVIMVTSSLLLALFANAELWSLMTNVVQYLLLGVVFVTEYLYRRIRFRKLPHENFRSMVTMLFTDRMR